MKSIEQIAAELQGYDPQALRSADVNRFLAELVAPVQETETVALTEALDRVLGADVVSPIDVPAHDNSAMDGFAFDGAELARAPLRLEVVGTAFAGKAWSGTVGQGQCLKIMTGAMMPTGLDTVIAQELVRIDADGIHVGAGLLQSGENRRLRGEDLRQGHCALPRGQRITAAALGLLASLGLPQVQVYRRLRVAYFSTGDEILSLGQAPREGAVYDSNRYTVSGLLRHLGVELLDLGVVPDQPQRLRAAFEQAASGADAIITSGGVSVGEADYTRAMMRELGDVAFWRIAMRPGRPMAVGRIMRPATTSAASGTVPDGDQAPGAGAILFGLPGNPVAVMVTFLAFVRPALLRMMGSNAEPTPMLRAHSLEALRKKPGRTEYQRGVVSTALDGRLQVRSTGNQGSGVLSSMVQANGLIVLHHEQGHVAAGDLVDVMMLDGVC